MKLTINIDILPGTNIRDAISEASCLAERIGVAFAIFGFNGIEVSVPPNADVAKGIIDVMDHKGSGYVIVERMY